MAWVTWRQHRSQALGALGLVVAFAVAAVLTHLRIGSAFDRDSLSACLPPATRTGCDIIVPHFESEFSGLVTATPRPATSSTVSCVPSVPTRYEAAVEAATDPSCANSDPLSLRYW